MHWSLIGWLHEETNQKGLISGFSCITHFGGIVLWSTKSWLPMVLFVINVDPQLWNMFLLGFVWHTNHYLVLASIITNPSEASLEKNKNKKQKQNVLILKPLNWISHQSQLSGKTVRKSYCKFLPTLQSLIYRDAVSLLHSKVRKENLTPGFFIIISCWLGMEHVP